MADVAMRSKVAARSLCDSWATCILCSKSCWHFDSLWTQLKLTTCSAIMWIQVYSLSIRRCLVAPTHLGGISQLQSFDCRLPIACGWSLSSWTAMCVNAVPETGQNRLTSKRYATWQWHIPCPLPRDQSPATLAWLHGDPPSGMTIKLHYTNHEVHTTSRIVVVVTIKANYGLADFGWRDGAVGCF